MFLVKTADGAGGRPLKKMVIANSETIFVGGTVRISEGGVFAADADADDVYGICKGIMIGNVPIQNALASEYDGTWTAPTSSHQGTYAAAADNETAEKVQALIEPVLPGDVVRAEMDAAKGTTTGSDGVGSYISILTTNETLLDESSVTSTAAAATGTQFLIVGQVQDVGNKTVDVELVRPQRH